MCTASVRDTCGVSIRELAEGEWPLWRDLAIAAAKDSPDSFRPTTEDHRASSDAEWADLIDSTVRHPTACLWIAEVGNEPVGMVFARVDEAFEVAELGAMWVAASARRSGVGSALLDEVEVWATRHVAQVLECWVTEGNEAAIGLYESRGFGATEDTQLLRQGSGVIVRKMRMSFTDRT